MISKIHEINTKGNDYELVEKSIEDVIVNEQTVMSIDGSTDITGVALLRQRDSQLIYTMAFKRDNETPVAYKVRLKKEITKVLRNNKNGVQSIFYEEPFIGYAEAAANLLMLRTFIEEIQVENEPEFDYIKYIEVNNKRWKKLWLYPDKCPANSELEKAAVRNKMVELMPYMGDLTQDEIDATAMGIVSTTKLVDGREKELESKKRTRKFLYNVEFVAAESDDAMVSELHYIDSIPKVVMQNGISLIKLGPRANFDNTIYDKMMNDDKLIILKFNTKYHGNIILKHRIGHLIDEDNNNIYAFVWRKNRKKAD